MYMYGMKASDLGNILEPASWRLLHVSRAPAARGDQIPSIQRGLLARTQGCWRHVFAGHAVVTRMSGRY